MPELDLTHRKDNPADDEPTKSRGRSERSTRRHRADIRDRLTLVFERLAESLEGRGDAELAAIVREDTRAMVGGLVNVTKRAPGLATPILGGLAVLEPLIAFGRIFRLLLRRAGERRAAAFEGLEPDGPGEQPAQPPPLADDPPPIAEPWRLDT